MARDFTVSTFRSLINKFIEGGYSLKPCGEYDDISSQKVIILRHDVDKFPENSLVTAEIENDAGVSGTYYFRCSNGRFEEEIIKQIRELGHEIGYHYEDLNIARRKAKGKRTKSKGNGEEQMAAVAIASFRENLSKLRTIATVNTICMHGSPLSSADSRVLWKYYDYGTMGIKTEPYFDFSLDDMLYLTDTGRKWDGTSVSVHDRVYARDAGYYSGWKRKPQPGSAMLITEKSWAIQQQHRFRKTENILQALNSLNFPERLMITFHPQRWNDSTLPWLREYLWQNSKNAIKFFMIKGI